MLKTIGTNLVAKACLIDFRWSKEKRPKMTIAQFTRGKLERTQTKECNHN
jgi:hypothetical protein